MPDLEEEDRRVRIADLLLRLRRVGITDQRVLSAIEAVPRDLFVEPDSRDRSYSERALPIDCGQTISAPVIVGMMTMAIDPQPDDRILEVGTGSGYQASVLSKLCARVYTVDRFRTLVSAAESRFTTLKLTNITTAVGDGMKGWPEHAPFDKIIVTAAGEEVPEALFGQLRGGGVLVAPVGPQDGVQALMRYSRTKDGIAETKLADVRFVPLIPGVAERL
ncbi:MAG: protein-L-isoaspartate(D-aspartate) O-methyltransferase [Bauldia sp.]|uniref:protein-L-isoaspartate(D-aspartate) O-methyltransferase n=1 Tax=Bauldia sp. TaxID=2575872 RepID=UPI001D4BAF62|nr:protein-L-isoaspartate(D-aspartate) O-methyltransferase [Bauldia sp.]MCB1495338.1 protein-L-isoaspartate(D-aspartate) O-methyltransferase [Bauldia sp.]